MAFSILNKRMIENENIKNIVDKMENYAIIFDLDQQRELNINFDISTVLTLKDYDDVAKKGLRYRIMFKKIEKEISPYGYIMPIIKYNEIKENSKIISEDDNTTTIEYGRGLTASVKDGDSLQKINNNFMMGEIIESNRKITMFLDKEGNKTQLKVYKNQQTNEEYVFLTKREDGSIDDSYNIQATFIGVVSPLRWIVEKSTGIAICEKPLFYSERCRCEYEESELSKFLESDEFSKELCVQPEKKEEKTTKYKNPFGDKKEKLNLEEKIRRVLMGEKRIPYLVGHPGIGKTQIAKSINKNYLAYNIATFDPDAFTGKTSIVPGDKIITTDGDKVIEHNEKGRTAKTEPEWHTELVELSNKCRENGKRCVLLLDEFDKLTPNMQVYINGIVDEPRTIAGWEIPNNVDIILAGNTEEYSDAAFNISGEVASRISKLEVKVDAIDWLKWATKHNIDPIVKAYLHCFPNEIIHDVKDKNGDYDYSRSLTPRSWDQKISEELKASRKIGAYPYLDPYMDEKNRKVFEEFISIYFELGVEEILKGNFMEDTFDLTHDKIQMIINCLIATATTEEEITNCLQFIKLNNINEYQALFEKRWIELNNTNEDILKLRLAKSELNERSSSYGK